MRSANPVSAPGSNEQQALLQHLYDQMAPEALTPLWEVLHALVPSEPSSPAVVHKWAYASMRDYLMRAGDLISAEQAERRVLILENPGLAGLSAITPSLYAGLQLILPGEIAPCHRHTQCALRFVMEGEGAFTAVDGEKAVMRPFDLVLTPGMQWHDHGNPTDKPMIWLDGLDIPTVRLFDASFSERLLQTAHPETVPTGDTLNRYGANLRPMRGSRADRRPISQPLFHYPYDQWRKSLLSLAANAEIDPHLGHALEFINPGNGGSSLQALKPHPGDQPTGPFSWWSKGKALLWSTARSTAFANAMCSPFRRGMKSAFRPQKTSSSLPFPTRRLKKNSISTRNIARDPYLRTPTCNSRQNQQRR
jgi:gentisate 1,2-dioxygenase